MVTISFKLNGKPVTLDVRPEQTLLSALRDDLDTTGPKEGCAVGECGACTVIMDGRAVKTCIIPAAQADGTEIITVDGLASGDVLHPIQEAFIECNAVQCGFCTAGFIMTGLAYVQSHPHPTRDEIRAALSGNLCRCTGYEHIIDAVEMYANSL